MCFLEARGQLCTGAMGVPIISNTFGSGSAQFAGPYPGISGIAFQYKAGEPDAGQYTITKNNFGMNADDIDGWYQIEDYTSETADGYMMLVNGDETTRSVFKMRHNTLCPNTTYEFSMFIMNLYHSGAARPNLTFSVELPDGTVLKTYQTGDIPESLVPTWLQKGVVFNTGAYTDIIINIISNGTTGIGNDFAVDDMAIRSCGPIVVSKIDASTDLVRNVCFGDNPTYTFSATLMGGYNNPQFQWEVSTGGVEESNWIPYTGPGANTNQITISYNNAHIGRYIYRLLIAENGNINSPICRVVSQFYIININKLPEVLSLATSGSTCEGGQLTIDTDIGSEVIDAYSWTGPNNFTSNLKNPTIDNLTQADAGLYVLTVTNKSGCTSHATLQLVLSPPIVGTLNMTDATVCANEPVQLVAGGGTSYKWLPATGLSNPNIANPVARPAISTAYKVTISNGSCSVEKSVIIMVSKAAVANAGKDKNVLKGKSVALEGKISGDNITSYYWAPSDYLDNPLSLNPIATPPVPMTYTLHAVSDCNEATDEMTVEVFPDIQIPNAFTPNGDGINDVWGMPALATFKNPRLVVVNRFGIKVFESHNNTAWDGKSKGKAVPPGTYYYTLYINNDYKLFQGWVLLTR
ncbi:MAG: gliding motility-associated C-terminal domain-containing protein [Pedobacter sp.]|nr:gliding motility-associated C-terminal domain-containing protein [Pedobacter sp.]